MDGCHYSQILLLVSLLCLSLLDALPARAQLKPGDTLGKENWQAAKGLMPDPILRRFEDGSYRAKVIALPNTMNWSSKFTTASATNAGKFSIDAEGSLIENSTQTYPPFLYGYPFPQLDSKDPQAATKAMYNFSYTLMQPDDADRFSNLHWVTPTALGRYAEFQGQILFYGSRFSGPIPNPYQTLRKLIIAGVAPYEVVGVVTLEWSYLDPKQWNSLWTFIPALKRVRVLNAANGSDGLFASDLAHDDPYLFSGKVPYFTWKLVGARDALVPYTLPNPKLLRPVERGYELESPLDLLAMGWDTPGWTGKAWWPTNYNLVTRPVWVVEATAKDSQYAYSRQVLWIDRELYIGYYKEAYDRDGQLWRVILNSVSLGQTANGDFSIAQPDFTLSVNELHNRATVELPLKPGQRLAFDVGLTEELFTLSELMKRGK
ncbi:MAG TPA: DUF1329 domain-containing protein [Candidatus Binatia bacterium]|nr:DUF1329 domain-containing protein [Candidatus Binatia bacterium]